ncbi:lengsin [Eubacteriales bacterium OttesenSCG-928-N14]|nr:lengsin [Eubacteriales bacterium OttesenSCG-928-N14]
MFNRIAERVNAMAYSAQQVLEFVEQNDVKFIRLAFCDIRGIQKNISIMPGQLGAALTHGISVRTADIAGYGAAGQQRMVLKPVPSTMSILPWRPQQGRVLRLYCDLYNADGTPYACDARAALKTAVASLKQEGYQLTVGFAGDFYLFQTDDNGNPTLQPFDAGGYLDISPLDRGENVRREICLTMEQMGISPASSQHEAGPGQHCMQTVATDALAAADDCITYRWVVKTVASRNGLFASFLPQPIAFEPGSGLLFYLHLSQNDAAVEEQTLQRFANGIYAHLDEISAIANPIGNSYQRLNKRVGKLALQIQTMPDGSKRLCVPFADGACNPYAVLCLLIGAGIEGLHAPAELPQKDFPKDLSQAVEVLKQSTFVRQAICPFWVEQYLIRKQEEMVDMEKEVDFATGEFNPYFPLI